MESSSAFKCALVDGKKVAGSAFYRLKGRSVLHNSLLFSTQLEHLSQALTPGKEKLEAFATNNDNLEEIFENKEQIEVSRFYERLPKPQAIAVKEWLEGKVYFRETE